MSAAPDWFDPIYYLSANHDVRASGQNPWRHYQTHGKAEGRSTGLRQAEILDQRLWRGFEEDASARLKRLAKNGVPAERAMANWFLARWHASYGRWERALEALRSFYSLPGRDKAVPHAGPYLLGVQAALKTRNTQFAAKIQTQLRKRYGNGPDTALSQMLIIRATQAQDTQINAQLESIYTSCDLAPATLRQGTEARFDRLSAQPVQGADLPDEMPLITVIVPVFNAADVLPTALASLAAQDWHNIEVLIIDDFSEDGSRAIAQHWAARDSRFRVIAQAANQGAYVARNAGFAAAQGLFTTVLDADDWAHPARIRLQAQALLQDDSLMGNTSHWVRASPDLDMTLWRLECTWIFRNISSLMIRTQLRDTLGFWDRVRVNADTEYYHRILARFGEASLSEVMAGVPLSFGRTTDQSLTMQSALQSRTQFHGVRRLYHDAALLWHACHKDTPDALHMAQFPAYRAFNVPAQIGPSDGPAPETDFDKVSQAPLFDAQWYRQTYADVVCADLNPALHYLQTGAAQGRDPGPRFSTRSYAVRHQLQDGQNALLHWTENGADHPASCDEIKGQLVHTAAQRPVLVFATADQDGLVGAGRGLLRVLQDLRAQGGRPVVVLPGLPSPDLWGAIEPLVQAVEIIPHQPRRYGTAPHPDTCTRIAALIAQYTPDQVQVLDAACAAALHVASRHGIETHLYLDNLPKDAFGLHGADLRKALLRDVDRFILHRHDTDALAWLGPQASVTTRQLSLEPALFTAPPAAPRRTRVATIGALEDAGEIAQAMLLARYVADLDAAADFVLIGPLSRAVQSLLPLGPLVQHLGYKQGPIDTLAQADIVLDLAPRAWGAKHSTFEAAAAGKIIVSHARPGVPVIPGHTGLTVPAGNTHAAARAIAALCATPQSRSSYTVHARLMARRYLAQ